MFANYDKHYPSRSGQTSLATAVTNLTKPVTKNNFGPSILKTRVEPSRASPYKIFSKKNIVLYC